MPVVIDPTDTPAVITSDAERPAVGSEPLADTPQPSAGSTFDADPTEPPLPEPTAGIPQPSIVVPSVQPLDATIAVAEPAHPLCQHE